MRPVVVFASVGDGVRRCWVVVAVLAALVGAPGTATAAQTTSLMPGVTYTRDVRQIRGERVVFHVVTTPKPGGLYSLKPVLSNGRITGTETVSSMQTRMSGNATVVGVNADLFNWQLGYPSGIFMRDGVLHGRPTSARSSLGIGIDGLLRIARIGFFGTWAIGEAKRQALDQLNRPLAKGEVGIFTSAWGERTPTASNAVDVVVSGVPATKANVDLTGQIASMNNGGGTRIPEDGIVVQALGPPGKKLRADALPGSPFVAKLILKPWWEQVRDAVGGGPAIVRGGKISLPTTEDFSSAQLLPRHPRTAVGQLRGGKIVLVAADGRQSFSAGVNLRDLAEELRRFGVVTGMAFDAGGSTTIAFNGDVLNSPSDGAERAVSDALMVLYYGVYASQPANGVVSPNGDGVAEGQRLAYKVVRPSTVEARLIGPGNKVAWKWNGEREPGRFPLEPAAKELDEGKWRFVVSAVDGDGNRSRATRRFTVNETLGFLRLSADSLRVTKKRSDTLRVTFRTAHTARVRVTVENAGGVVVKTLLSQSGRSPGEVAVTWNGRDSRGRIVAAGAYTVRVHATNTLGAVQLADRVQVKRR